MFREICLQQFTREEDDLFREYRRIKHRVFVVEQGWTTLQDQYESDLVREDDYDAKGRYVIACTGGGVPIGVVRGIPVKEGFPHQGLFERHLRRPEMQGMLLELCTINSLAVLAPYRRSKSEVSGSGWRGGVGTLLLLALCRSMEQEGLRAAVATGQGIASIRFMRHFGFSLIDRPTSTTLHSTFPMTNVGLVFGAPMHRAREDQSGANAISRVLDDAGVQALLRYFESCERNIRGEHDLESLFA